jgi:hypothetical protein
MRWLSLIVGVLFVAIVPHGLSAQAQQTVTPPADTTPNQIKGFEQSLLLAVDSAAGRLNSRVREALPNVQIQLDYETRPIVTGALVPEAGAVFHVLIPAIAELDLKMANVYLSRRPTPPTPVVRTVDPARVTANSIVEPDPNTITTPLTEPDKEYTTFMRLALIDAVVDHAITVRIPAGQNLTVIADELQTQPASAFNPRSRTLILQIKGEDLIALRENRIDREEAKKRIKESRYPN